MAYNESTKDRSNVVHCSHQSERKPPPGVPAPKGGLFAPCGLPKPLPLGEVALRSNDGEGKPGAKEPLRSDGQALCQSDTIAVSVILGQQPCPLSLAPLASSPKGGAIGMSVRLRLSTTSQSASQTAPLVGEPLAKRRSFPLCQSLPSVGEVALRSNDGEVELLSQRGSL